MIFTCPSYSLFSQLLLSDFESIQPCTTAEMVQLTVNCIAFVKGILYNKSLNPEVLHRRINPLNRLPNRARQTEFLRKDIRSLLTNQ
jgi:hypothetical protein